MSAAVPMLVERRGAPRTPAEIRRVIREVEGILANPPLLFPAPERAILEDCLARCRADLRNQKGR